MVQVRWGTMPGVTQCCRHVYDPDAGRCDDRAVGEVRVGGEWLPLCERDIADLEKRREG